MNVLITDGENRSALAVTRSLGKKGCRIIVTSKDSRALSSSSRYCAKSFRIADPLCFGQDYIKSIIKIVEMEDIQVVIPITEQSIYLCNKHASTFSRKVILACATSDQMHEISNKYSLFKMAERLKVPVPTTLYFMNKEELLLRENEIVDFPVVIKPAFSKIADGDKFLSAGVRYASSREELKKTIETGEIFRFPFLVQEKIIGPGTGLFTLYDTKRHLALFSHQRIQEKPPSGGVSVISESVPLDPEMVDAADKILTSVGWTGIAMIEFKRDIRDGQSKLMEVNGRFWGSLQLAISSGIDFPSLYIDYLLGKNPHHPISNFKIGNQLKWFLGTLDYLLIRLKNKDGDLYLPPNAPTKTKAIFDFIKIKENNTTFDVYQSGDIKPFISEIANYITHIMVRK